MSFQKINGTALDSSADIQEHSRNPTARISSLQIISEGGEFGVSDHDDLEGWCKDPEHPHHCDIDLEGGAEDDFKKMEGDQ